MTYEYKVSAPPAQGTNGLAIASLITSLAGLHLVGIILGHVSLGQIKRRPQAGRGLALAGVIVGYAALTITLLLAAVAIPLAVSQQSNASSASVQSDLANAYTAVIAYGTNNPGVTEVPSLTDGTLAPYGLTLGHDTASIVATGDYRTGVTLVATSVSGHRYQVSDGTGIVDLGQG